MSNAKHTAGRWSRNIKPARKYPVIFAGRNTHVARVIGDGMADEELEANCALITAAPDLLAAAQDALAFMLDILADTSIGDIRTENALRAAIAKATGGN